MKSRSVLACTIIGAVVLIAYQLVSRTLVGEVYFNAYGVFIGAALSPDAADRTTVFGPLLARQLVVNILVALLLCLLAVRLKLRRPPSVATGSAVAGLVVGVVLSIVNRDWAGFTIQYAIAETIDTALGLFVTGLVVGLMSQRLDRTGPIQFSTPAGNPLAGVSAG
jgi:hypothetical protein